MGLTRTPACHTLAPYNARTPVSAEIAKSATNAVAASEPVGEEGEAKLTPRDCWIHSKRLTKELKPHVQSEQYHKREEESDHPQTDGVVHAQHDKHHVQRSQRQDRKYRLSRARLQVRSQMQSLSSSPALAKKMRHQPSGFQDCGQRMVAASEDRNLPAAERELDHGASPIKVGTGATSREQRGGAMGLLTLAQLNRTASFCALPHCQPLVQGRHGSANRKTSPPGVSRRAEVGSAAPAVDHPNARILLRLVVNGSNANPGFVHHTRW
jgi:hypothetical protein